MLVKLLRTLITLVILLVSTGVSSSQVEAPEKQKLVTIGHLPPKSRASIPQPEYPAAAASVGAKGTVSVGVLINELGEVEKITGVRGHILLRAAAVSAAKKARFEPVIIGGKPAKAYSSISFNFTGNVPEAPPKKFPHANVISLGNLSSYAKVLLMPRLARGVSPRPVQNISIRVKIDLSTGNVVEAQIESGADPFSEEAALNAAKGTKFEAVLPEFKDLQGAGFLAYRPTDFNRPTVISKKPTVFIIDTKKVLNDLAIELPRPDIKNISQERAKGTIKVFVIDEVRTGEVLAAKAISGPEHLREISEQAATKARFPPAMINGGDPAYVKGLLSYKFGN